MIQIGIYGIFALVYGVYTKHESNHCKNMYAIYADQSELPETSYLFHLNIYISKLAPKCINEDLIPPPSFVLKGSLFIACVF